MLHTHNPLENNHNWKSKNVLQQLFQSSSSNLFETYQQNTSCPLTFLIFITCLTYKIQNIT